MNESERVQLTRIEGTINLVNERLGTLKADVMDHGIRITKLETDNTLFKGQRLGVTATIKSAWLAGGALVTAFVLAVLKKMGLL